MAVLEHVVDRVYRVRDRFVNLYLIDAERVVLVDSGTKKAEPAVREALEELGREEHAIDLVLLTHHHVDHVGTAGVWQRVGAKLAIHATDAPVLAGKPPPKARGVGGRAKFAVAFSGMFSRTYAVPPTTADRTFRGGDVLEAPGLELRVLHAPGHTLGSCAFHLIPDDVLFAGDAVNARGGSPQPPWFVEDDDAAIASFRALVKRPARFLCPGHGDPVPRR